ncbi:MAG: hypothetical protein KTR35_19800, partial [Gammaproteobacteria bacterium]|nr:hypothetical protein [Gammaproteobacteria bacterium]
LHLDVLSSKLSREFKVEAVFGRPQVAYRETMNNASIGPVRHRFKRQSGGPGMFAELELRIDKIDGVEIEVVDETRGGALPSEFFPAVERGIKNAALSGRLDHGHPIVGVRVTIVDAMTHKNDSSAIAFERCAAQGFRTLFESSDVHRLEPMMTVVALAPEGEVKFEIIVRVETGEVIDDDGETVASAPGNQSAVEDCFEVES